MNFETYATTIKHVHIYNTLLRSALYQEKLHFTDHEWTDSSSQLFASTTSAIVLCLQDHIPTFMISLEEPAARIMPLKTTGIIVSPFESNPNL